MKEFKKLSKRDFDNGAVRQSIEIALIEREELLKSHSSKCQLQTQVSQNLDDILKSKELLKKLNNEIRKTLDKIDAILGCKGYHDVDEFYKK